ncbi:MAG: hypothetical protein M1835_002135 [Candelina submexicana]|nr:MAG: hypothetical protein M1835_002135 [Candelina submexicana]
MQFINRSLLVAAAAFSLARSTVGAPFQILSERAAPNNYTGPGVYSNTNGASRTNVDLYNGGAASGTPINGWCVFLVSFDNCDLEMEFT